MQPSTPAAGGRVRRSPPTTVLAAEAPPRVGLRGAPSRAARSARSPGRPRSPAAGNSRSSPSSRRSAQSGLPRLPEGEPHAGRPRGPPSPPPPPQPGEAATSGRAGAGPAAPSRAPGPAECVAAPAGGYFEREGSGPTSVFSAFSWPPARPPPARALGCPRSGRGGHVAGGKRRAAAIRLGLRPRSRPGRRPAAVGTCALGPGGAAGLLIARLALAAAAGRPLPVRPSSDEH